MPDVHSAEQRRRNMQAVRSGNTKAEVSLKAALRAHDLTGYRCSPKNVAGRPDVVFTRWKVAVFVDGCFWHGCPECYVRPETNREFWDGKLAANIGRDETVNGILAEQGWTVLRFWEHQVRRDVASVVREIERALALAGRPLRNR